ncbi:hypothetical protein ACFWP5_16770 [Streptomyces sp. NPDC058469]|uniref:hypothetical protein n=1 Tax=Streptomyces sp. NPDC058469 TaxID=3346514 RepID=UPI00365F9193
MTSPHPGPERLLVLGGHYTRHHDALQGIVLLRGPDPAGTLAQHIRSTQALAREALEVSTSVRTMPRLCHTPVIRAVMERATQLAALATLAADHLLDAVDILQTTATAHPASEPAPAVHHGETLLEAGRRTTLAGRLTSLGAEDCLANAELLAREMHRQHLGPDHRPPTLTPAQRTALESVAAGHVTLTGLLNKPYVRRGPTRITITTLRALQDRSLVSREPFPHTLHDERIHLAPDGCRALAALLAQPRNAEPTAVRPPAAPAVSAIRAAAR